MDKAGGYSLPVESKRNRAGSRFSRLLKDTMVLSAAVAAGGITIGRHPECDVVVADPRVSSRHAWLGIVGGKATLRDLKSTNGTFLNTQTRTSISETELRAGDMISFGGHQGDQVLFMPN
jgi:predicted component of type VI protein secretion system